MIKECLHCKNNFSRKENESIGYWTIKKYCSSHCKGKALIGTTKSESYKQTMKERMKGKQNSLGCKRSNEFRENLSKYWTNNPKHNHWIDGKGHERNKERSKDMSRFPYRFWRESVLKRDNYTKTMVIR